MHSGLQSLLGCSSGAFAQADKWLCHNAFDEYLYPSEAAWGTRADARTGSKIASGTQSAGEYGGRYWD